MGESRGELDLEQETLGADLGGDFRAQHLERNLAIVAEIVREEDDRHATFAELAADRVAAGECRFETGLKGGHRRITCSIARGSGRWCVIPKMRGGAEREDVTRRVRLGWLECPQITRAAFRENRMHLSLSHATSRRGATLICIAALAGFANSCRAADQGPNPGCAAPAPRSVVVTVRDSTSGAAAADGALGTLIGPGVDDTLIHVDSLTLEGGDQLGTFTVTIDRSGYVTWTAPEVHVTQKGICGNVLPVQLSAKLQRATP
jgi:hypothetical protein